MKITVELDLNIERDRRVNWVIMNWYQLEQDVQEAGILPQYNPEQMDGVKAPRVE